MTRRAVFVMNAIALVFAMFAVVLAIQAAGCAGTATRDPFGVLVTPTPTAAEPVQHASTSVPVAPPPASTEMCVLAPGGQGYVTVRECAGTACRPVGYLAHGARVEVTGLAVVRGQPWVHVLARQDGDVLAGWVWEPLVGKCESK